jgi:hypothetical protein
MSRAFRSRGFIAGIAGAVLILALACIGDIIEATRAAAELNSETPIPLDFHIELMRTALKSDAFMMAFPIICALPFTTAFVDDMKNGFIKQFLSRTSRRQYITGKLIACGFSGGLAVFIGIMLGFTGLSFMFEYEQLYLGEIIEKAYTFFFYGMFWSLVGFVLSAFTMNRFIAFVSPFILYYVLIILYERYFPTMHLLNPNGWQILEVFMLTAAVCAWFFLFARKRLINV